MIYRLIILLVFTVSSLVHADYNKNSLFDALVKKYANLKSLSGSFNDESRGITGTIKATTGNKYSIKTGTRTIVCDGITVWNYDASAKKVIINNAEGGSSTNSIDKLFFNFIENYSPSNLTKNDYGHTLELTKKNSQNPAKDKLTLWIDGKTLDIFRIQLNGESMVNSWGIVGLTLNKKFKKTVFSFKIPQGTEVIDLR
jgi:outer membrane lipoprotein-sorting protein